MQGLRAAARFGNLFLLGMAVLAGARPRRRCGAGCTAARSAGRSASRSSRSRTSSRCARRFTTRASTASRRSTRCSRRSPAASCSPKSPFYPPQAVFENAPLRPQLDRALAAADERLQRLHARRRIASYADSFWFFPQDYAIQAMRKAGVTHVMVHPPLRHRGGDRQDVAGRRRQPVSRTHRRRHQAGRRCIG